MFDVGRVLARVQSLSPEESRLVFAEEIFDWTDNYTEILQSQDTPEAKRALDAIGSLWIEYATMEQNLRQWKKVVKVYDDALNDPVASKASRVYLAYAEFCKFRGKISSAQKIYIKGLTAGLLEEQADRIWQDFLQTMRENGSPELSAEQLFAAVSSQVDSGSLTKPSLTLLAGLQKNSSDDFLLEEPASKRFKTEEAQSDTGLTESNFISPATRLSELLEKGIAETKPELGIRLPALTDLHEVSGLTVVDILTLHTSRPTMLFRSLNPENLKQVAISPAAGFSDIHKDLVGVVEQYFDMSIPMLCETERDDPESKISRVLDIIEALWINQGLNERYFDQWFSSVIQAQMKEESLLKVRFLEDEKQAINSSGSSGQSTTVDILRSRQKIEFRNFRIKCDIQVQILNAYVNHVMDNVLREQLRVLSLLDNFPHRVIEKIENRDGEQQENFALFKQIINALLLIRLHSRSRKNFLKSSQSADSLPIENTEDFEKSSQSVGALEAARAAAAATKKTTFKNKRRRSIQDPGSRYQHALYSSHYGVAIQPEAKVQYLDSNPQSSFQQILPSNLHKLAALLGKAKK